MEKYVMPKIKDRVQRKNKYGSDVEIFSLKI